MEPTVVYIVTSHEMLPGGSTIIDRAFTKIEDAERYLADANKKWEGMFLHRLNMAMIYDNYDNENSNGKQCSKN